MTDEEKREIDEARKERRSDSFLRNILDNLDQYAFGIITEHGYRELENKLNEHAREIEQKFHKWFIRGLVAFGIMSLGVILGLVGYGLLLNKQGDLLAQFKETRKEFVRDSCLAQNKRHDNTIAKLNTLSAKSIKQRKTATGRKRAEDGRVATIGLIDALAPKQNCKKLAAVSVGDAKPPPPEIKTPTRRRRSR